MEHEALEGEALPSEEPPVLPSEVTMFPEEMEAEALPMMMSEEPALSEVTAEAEPPAPPPDLTNEQRAALAAFDTMDTDGDGELSAEEIHRALSGYDSASLERVQEIVSRADVDGNGLVSKQEYLDALAADIVPRGWLGNWLGWTVSRVAAAFSGEAMPEAAAEERYAANEGAQTPLTNKTLRIWVGRWYCGDRSLPDISTWNTSQVTDMSELFKPQINRETKKPYANQENFNGDISSWDTSNVTTMHGMFQGAKSFNRPIGKWNVEKVTDMAAMFLFASKFNQPIGGWKVHNVTDMSLMFNWASAFNQPIGSWNVEKVTSMRLMFDQAWKFNQPIGDWRVDNVRNMHKVFQVARSFNQPLNKWNVSNVTNMSNMFNCASSFNQPIGDWNIEQVKNMENMFRGAYNFNMGWNIRRDCRTANMLGHGDNGGLAMQKMRPEMTCCTIS